MKYVVAKFLKGDNPVGRGYTYKAPKDVKVGDVLQNVNGTKLIIADETVPNSWISSYGENNIAILSKIKESEESK